MANRADAPAISNAVRSMRSVACSYQGVARKCVSSEELTICAAPNASAEPWLRASEIVTLDPATRVPILRKRSSTLAAFM